jgi:hypothetical protein
MWFSLTNFLFWLFLRTLFSGNVFLLEHNFFFSVLLLYATRITFVHLWGTMGLLYFAFFRIC